MSDASALIAHQFERDTHAVRIKKLMLYACKDWWENDSARLSAIDLEELVDELRQRYPTLERLRSHLNHLVGMLNKSAEYQVVAQFITTELSVLYVTSGSDSEATTQIVSSSQPVTPHAKIAHLLESDANLSRIKKLLICVCRKYWEANPYVIEQTLLTDLLQELTKAYATLDCLRVGLAAAVKTLNKPIEYALIAEAILQVIEPLYSIEIPPAKPPRPTATDLAPTAEAYSPSKPLPIDLFDLRLEIFKYTNPLRAKILLFSLAYYRFEFRSQDWSNLKLYSLEGLLRTILSQAVSTECTSNRTALEDLQHRLQEMAQQFSDPSELGGGNEYLDVGQALVKALKPNYSVLQQQIQHALQSGSAADITCASPTQVVAQPSASPEPHQSRDSLREDPKGRQEILGRTI
ncbi:MAG: hypothetical protein KME13_05340 [Myxacorys californica WJT36-NPBG1]|jgi:hypothetical protein|nr:hypothetical protein [Myxacorys californica WJT36-NPBG1]